MIDNQYKNEKIMMINQNTTEWINYSLDFMLKSYLTFYIWLHMILFISLD